ncbi:ABC transporter substrate-binding protein [Ideonella sp.]|uniref:ABC transporter substrate-binding protein n=1 Tax=Ideonella sp. TaxID=1929293 RepID=UPI002B4718C8|nr:ABC transporter substrate-binding protein [Ideonella sp.]HJV72272.1 ABC transporter substrate-binding protein [Ideonella sp.]
MTIAFALAAGPVGADTAGAKVLRYAIENDITTLDPSGYPDVYSEEVLGSIFEPLYRFDYLARPVKVRPQLAAALPEASADLREFTVRLRHGIFYSDDPAFGGQPREVVAADVVYAIKRIFDPRWKSPQYPTFAAISITGLDALRQRAIDGKQPFDYTRPVEGLVALDAHTVRFRLDKPSPRFVFELTGVLAPTAIAREVVERYGDAIGEHPVGTGPFVLAAWRRGSQIVLARNPAYRDVRYDEEATPGDTEAEAISKALRGRRLPMVDRVEIAIIEEDQPRWLAFLQGDMDLAALPPTYVPVAYPGGRVAPGLARHGLKAQSAARPDVVYTVFNMEDPVVGGYAPAQVALRRAIGLGYDNDEEVRTLRRGLGLAAQSIVAPWTFGYDPALKSEMSEYDPARANALLDLYGYADRDGDGWRERPDGAPLVLQYHTSAALRPYNELWERRMTALHLKMAFVPGLWPEQARAARAGKLMLWFLSWNASVPDAESFLRLGYGPAIGGENLSRFNLPAFNTLYERQALLPDGPERSALIAESNRLLLAYMPIKAHVHRVGVTMYWPRLVGYRRHPFLRSFHTFVDVTPTSR